MINPQATRSLAGAAPRSASGRNGGFCSASLTHGLANGLERFPAEMPLLERLGEKNLREIGETVARYGIDCDFALTGDARADRNEGRRDAWLRLLDRLGLGFDS